MSVENVSADEILGAGADKRVQAAELWGQSVHCIQ